ncbi:hypothetical protein EP227_01305 [bacterium]|nr:MAG: hypothetical protein EP227_01305 [bacterium]
MHTQSFITGFSNKEKLLLSRISKQKNLYLTFSIVSVIIALVLLAYYGLILKNMNSLRFVIVILVLLGGRAHLRQYRSAVLLHKVKLWLENSDDRNKANTK